MRLRPVAAALAATAALTLGGGLMTATPASADPYDDPHLGFAPAATVLEDSTPRRAGLDPKPITDAVAAVHAAEEAPAGGHPLFAGAVGLMGHEGKVVERDASGWALRWADPTTELPRDQWEPVRTDTVFDLASVSKLFTSIAVVQLVQEGAVSLDAPVATYLPEFAANGKQDVTVRQLLTHTSGFVSWLPLWSAYPDKAARIKAVMDQPLDNPPGTTYLYSDLNLITLGVMVERLRGAPLDVVVHDRITAPLGMDDTGYNPTDPGRTAATEYQASPPRGMVRGEVHDENAWSLGGVAGHAGVFSTADDLAVMAQALLNGGAYEGHRILTRQSVTSLITNFNGRFPDDAHGLGFELDQRWYMDALAGPRTAGHTGYTGTSVVIDFASRSFAILLTNRVHPSRDWGSVNEPRRQWAHGLAAAMPLRPQVGRTAWYAGGRNAETSTLTTTAVAAPTRGALLEFDLFLDTETTDPLYLERSTDGGTTWMPVSFQIRDRGVTSTHDGVIAGSGVRRWVHVRADVPEGAAQLRWRHVTDATSLGRGVAVDGIRVTARGSGAVLLDAERRPATLTSVGWEPAGAKP
ncbi:serine hydrolase domain-containing protein [Terracoccus luteus]|uniref:CubicO group peptidase (Beta-lactamase class C family) n=1 Tax=Terracoccus luteus TaxID=53356 RepID=A0A839PYD5_9MICO|nr:serine hydrolase domain-containing protein [Terracoccus luteus]MBB2988429.1 CubicO group peptidase (beta-lactamase class C family) [Terracoccus luteus]MCP2174044.1 CubicO group peptidase (beta-lactamase class C family) [Terracoccus luteus]